MTLFESIRRFGFSVLPAVPMIVISSGLVVAFPAVASAGGHEAVNRSAPGDELLLLAAVGGSAYDTARDIESTSDGGWVVAAETGSAGSGSADALLLKYDADGALEWGTVAGGIEAERVHALAQTSDGGYLVTGYTTSNGSGTDAVMLLRFDASGTLLWARMVDSAGTDHASDVHVTADGGCLVAGSLTGAGAGAYDALLLKFSSSGVLEWARTAGGTNNETVGGVEVCDGGDIVLAGSTWSYGAGGGDAMLARFDGSGNLLWATAYGGTENDLFRSVQEISPGGDLIVAGQAYSYGAGNADYLLMQCSSAGAVEWSRTAGGTASDHGWVLDRTADGGFVIGGHTYSYGPGTIAGLFLKYDGSGSFLWAQTAGGSGSDRIYGLDVASDDTILSIGQTSSFGAGSDDAILVKTDPNGIIMGCPHVESCVPSTDQPSPTVTAAPLSTTSPSFSADVLTFTSGSYAPDLEELCAVECPDPEYFLTMADGEGSDLGEDVIATSDGGFLVGGVTGSGLGELDYMLIKYDAAGTIEWSRTAGGYGEDWGYAVAELRDGGFVIAGYSEINVSSVDVLVVKFDAAGTRLWARTVGGDYFDAAFAAEATTDGGVVVAGVTYDAAADDDLLVIKFDSDGTLEWSKTSVSPGQDIAYGIRQTDDGGYIVTGESNIDLLLLKLDEDGNMEWGSQAGVYGVYDVGYDVVQTADGGYAAVGVEDYYSGPDPDGNIFLIRFDQTGNQLWSRSINLGDANDFNVGYGIEQTSDGGFVIGGTTHGVHPGRRFIYFKADDMGYLNWAQVAGGTDVEEGLALDLTCDGGLVMTGYSSISPWYDGSVMLLNTDSGGRVYGCPYVNPCSPDEEDFVAATAAAGLTMVDFSVSLDSTSAPVTSPVYTELELCHAWPTIAAAMACVPGSGTVPFSSQFTVELFNLYTGQTRRIAARIDAVVGNGNSYSNWKSGWTNVTAGSSYQSVWSQNFPALGSVIGDNVFSLWAEDVTPSPYNQPPYPPAGHTDTDGCVVTANAP